MKLLCTTDPRTHKWSHTTPELYCAFSEHPEIEFYHVNAHKVVGNGPKFPCTRLKNLASHQEFLGLLDASTEEIDIRDFDLVVPRCDKPQPLGFYKALSSFEKSVPIINKPSAIRYMDRKSYTESFAADLMAEHMSTQDPVKASMWLDKFNTIVAKQDSSQGGDGVFKVWKEAGKVFVEDKSLTPEPYDRAELAFEYLFSLSTEEYQLVRFVRDIQRGDKRIVVLDGQILGAFVRKHPDSDAWIHNLSVKGDAFLEEATKREIEIINRTYGEFSKDDAYLLGYDFLYDSPKEPVLSEINCSNVGGLNIIKQLGCEAIYEDLIEWLLSYEKQLVAA